MLLKQFIIVFLIFYTFSATSQNMQKGYSFLETGNYKEAVTFFEDILKTYPKNKTARLCYGRAIGLNGDSNKAVRLFTNLLKDFPDDFEVKLNYAESLLWDKNYEDAKSFYDNLVKENDKSFPALLGYANTFSNLKLYDKALLFVDKALMVQPGNGNALISKKYIHLGLANEKTNQKKYKEAEKILNKNLLAFPEDKETLLNLANLYLISNQNEKAKKVYETLGKKTGNKLISLNGLALVSHLNDKNKEALRISESAITSITITKDTTIQNQTKERYIQALIWNKKYKQASSEIQKLSNTEGNVNWVLALRATLNIYKSDFKNSLTDYNAILKQDSTSFDGNLGKANTLKAIGNYNDAYKSASNTLTFYKEQKDALNFIKKLDETFTPFLETKTSYSFDNGDNKAYLFNTNIEFPISTKLKLFTSYSYRTTSNKTTSTKAISNNFLIGLGYQLMPSVVFKGNLGLLKSSSESNDYTQLLTDISLTFKPFKLQNLEISYKRDLQNFNADLLNREIVQNNFIINYSINTNFNVGSFIQYYYTSQNDNNTRNLLFASLYYNLMEKPSLKAGINYQNIGFKNQVPTIYFSPEKFHAVEVFFNLIKSETITKEKAWFYELTAATGLQFIEDYEKQSTYRIQGKLGYKFSDRCLVNLYGTQSNIASTTAAGFTFSEIGLRFKWLLTKKPIFKPTKNL